MAEFPKGKHNSKAYNNSWKTTTFPSQFGGSCCVCFEKVSPGEYIQSYKNSGRMCHPRCSDGEPRGSAQSSQKPGVIKYSNINEKKISREDISDTFALIIGNTDCSVCRISKGTPCTNSSARWLHRVRIDKFKNHHG